MIRSLVLYLDIFLLICANLFSQSNNYSINKIQLEVTDYSGVNRIDWPVTSGIPLPKGAVKDERHIALYDSNGKEIPLQTTVLSRYWEADSSIRWVLLDFRANVPAHGTSYYTVKYGEEINRHQFPTELKVKKEGNEVSINTGVLKFKVGQDFLSDVQMKTTEGWKEISRSEGGDMTMDITVPPDTNLPAAVLGKGRNEGHYSSRIAKDVKIKIEDNGPLRVQVKVEGWYLRKDGRRFGPWTLRVNAYAGKSYLKIYHTFVNSDLPERGLIKDVGIELPLTLNGEAKVTYGTSPISSTEATGKKSYYLLQDKWNRYETYEGKEEKKYDGQSEGWLDVTGKEIGVTAMFRNCAQLFPKEIKYQNNELTIFPYPEDGVGPLDLRREEERNSREFQAYKKAQPILYGTYLSPMSGVYSKHRFAYDFLEKLREGDLKYLSNHTALGFSRTHEINLYFHLNGVSFRQLSDFVKSSNDPLRAFALDHWYDRTDALGHFGWKDTIDFPLIENYFAKKINWAEEHQNKWFANRFWGIVNYGGTQSYWEKDLFTGVVVPGQWLWYLGGGWTNNEVDFPKHLFLYYLRTGDDEAYRFAESIVNQMMDVVTAHANLPDFNPVQVIDRWKIGGMNRHEYDPYGGGVLENHTWNEGLINYYYLTGYRRAYDVAMEIAGFVLRLYGHGNRIKQWQLYEHQFDRNASNSYRILLKTYELTGAKMYEDAAMKWRNYFIKYSPYSYKGLNQNTFMTVRYLVPTYELDYRLFHDDRVAEEIMNIAKWLADSLKNGSTDYFVENGFLAAALSFDITRGGGPLEDLLKVWWKELAQYERQSSRCEQASDFTSMQFNEFESLFYYLAACRDAGLTESHPPR